LKERILKVFIQYIYKPLLLWYLKKDRVYEHKGLKILVQKGVFHPRFFFSTRFLLAELEHENLSDKSFLELGAGSGLISFYASKRGAMVTATDINNTAVEGLKYNLTDIRRRYTIKDFDILHSDLFDNIPIQSFDYIIINPPYYPLNPSNESQMAWYCGEDFEYFEKLFSQIGNYLKPGTQVWVSLADVCDVDRIQEIASRYGFGLMMKTSKKILWERNFIYQVGRKLIE
jgi:release factor glutamine methyltransferase